MNDKPILLVAVRETQEIEGLRFPVATASSSCASDSRTSGWRCILTRRVSSSSVGLPTVMPPRLAINSRRGVSLQRDIRRAQAVEVVHVVQQRREPLFPVLSCCLTYSLEAIRSNVPALCPDSVTVGRVPLGQPASLHRLRCRMRGVIRRLLWYYRAVRLPRVVRHRRESLDFPIRPATLIVTGDHGLSRFPRAVLRCMHGVSDRAGFLRASRWRRAGCGLPPTSTASAPRCAAYVSRLNTWPARSPVNASPAQSPAPTHDSGSLWVATPSMFRTFIYCTAPV